MNDDAEDPEPFPDLDAEGALRAAFKKRDASSGSAQRESAAAQVAAHADRKGYELQGEIARGGMGVIVKAFDRDLTRDVALKVLRDELAPEPRLVRRFMEEARVTARLDHPGIVPVHEAGWDSEGRAYFAMRLVRGRDLRRIMELANANEEGWSRTRALSVFLKVCEAMAYAHDKGVLHRDLKPSNVMVGEFGEVYVMDWGLARVMGSADSHDLRLRGSSGAASESPIVTMDGEVLGTPCYMSPEQAQGRAAELDARSDVYSVGAMLYHLLAGEMPYVRAGTSLASRTVLLHLGQGPPRSLHEMRRDVPAELIAICERAMARDPRERYAGMLEMAEDLRAFLERRVVRAYETGAWAEAKKWVRRNKRLAAASAAAVLALVCGLIASLVLRAESDRNAKLAENNAKAAQRNEQLATERADDVLRLSALQELDDLGAEANQLWPPEPKMIPRYEAWLARARKEVDELPAHEARLSELRARALPLSEAEEAAARARHPRFAELGASRRKLDRYRRQFAALESTEATPATKSDATSVDPASLPSTWGGLVDLAWPLVDPAREQDGGEAQGLLAAQRAVELAADMPSSSRATSHNALAWALYANGRFDEALAAERQASEEVEPARTQRYQLFLADLEKSIDASVGPERREKQKAWIAELESRMNEIEAEVSTRTVWTFSDTQDKWWHNQLEKLVEGLRAFSDPEKGLLSSGASAEYAWGVEKRLEFARTIEERSVSGPEAAARWTEALASIRDTSECPMYDGLALVPQLGMLPIGRDPESGLWEFAHLQSGEPPQRGRDERLLLEEKTGLVLVLVPGWTFWMGAQRDDPTGHNYDPRALDEENPVHEVSLSPFFLSKYEMTQGQWLRTTATSPSVYGPNYYEPGWNAGHKYWSARHPVEAVSWTRCSQVLARSSLVLPTEAQWEYACRAGTSSAFWTGDDPESLQGAANLSDTFWKRNAVKGLTSWEPWLDDGEAVHGEVGSYRANAFGLHDMHGNVQEWCRDGIHDYRYVARPGDGERQGAGPTERVIRGGSFGTLAAAARSAFRSVGRPDLQHENIGVRPARSIWP